MTTLVMASAIGLAAMIALALVIIWLEGRER
jgi:hypothetical protein